jgi:hypothetical protein
MAPATAANGGGVSRRGGGCDAGRGAGDDGAGRWGKAPPDELGRGGADTGRGGTMTGRGGTADGVGSPGAFASGGPPLPSRSPSVICRSGGGECPAFPWQAQAVLAPWPAGRSRTTSSAVALAAGVRGFGGQFVKTKQVVWQLRPASSAQPMTGPTAGSRLLISPLSMTLRHVSC